MVFVLSGFRAERFCLYVLHRPCLPNDYPQPEISVQPVNPHPLFIMTNRIDLTPCEGCLEPDCYCGKVFPFFTGGEATDGTLAQVPRCADPRPLRLSMPSAAYPARAGEACMHLASYFGEMIGDIGIYMMETKGSLAYTDEDLPPCLTGTCETGTTFHVHLPVDLDWEASDEELTDTLARLKAKTDYLQPWAYVLHPPRKFADLRRARDIVVAAGYDPATILIENIRSCDILEVWCELKHLDFGLCIDLGHLLAYGQQAMLAYEPIWPHVRLVHLHAPGPRTPGKQFLPDDHRDLSHLDKTGQRALRCMLAKLSPRTTLMLEVFSEDAIAASLEQLDDWFDYWTACAETAGAQDAQGSGAPCP